VIVENLPHRVGGRHAGLGQQRRSRRVAHAAGERRQVHRPAQYLRRRTDPAVVVEALPVVVLAVEQVSRQRVHPDRRCLFPGGRVDRHQRGHVQVEHQFVAGAVQRRRVTSRRIRYTVGSGELFPGCVMNRATLLGRTGEGGQRQRTGDLNVGLAEPVPQRRPPRPSRPGHEQHPGPPRPVEQGVAQQQQQVVGGPPVGVLDHQQQVIARFARRYDGRGGRVAEVVGRPDRPPVRG
jgi:hypothetical protein